MTMTTTKTTQVLAGIALFVSLFSGFAHAQTFNGNIVNTAANSTIPSAGTGGCAVAPQTTGGTIFNNAVAGLPAGATVASVQMNLTHTFDSDLDVFLVAPNGQILELTTDNGAANDNFTDTVFQDGAPNITTGAAPFTGTFSAEGTLVATNCGIVVTPTVSDLAGFTPGQNGTWQLLFLDDAGADVGTMLSWSITFAAPAQIPTLSQWGMVILSLLLVLAAWVSGRRRIRQESI
jgi:subtilisin-like proprotein convertase family protein